MDIDIHINNLDSKGYTVIKSLMDISILKALLEHIKTGTLNTGDGVNVPRLNRGSDFIYNPFFYDLRFFKLFRGQEIDKILQHFLNDRYYKGLEGLPNYILRSMICRSSKDQLPWHIDSFVPFQGNYPTTFQVVIPLEEFRTDTGPTLLVPASHRIGEYARQDLTKADGVVELAAEVGDVIIWDARIWHAAKANESDSTRWAVISTFTRWWIKQNYRYPEVAIKLHGVNSYSDADLIILGAASETPSSHMESVDLKGGIERIEKLRKIS